MPEPGITLNVAPETYPITGTTQSIPHQPPTKPRAASSGLAAPEPGITLNIVQETYPITGSSQHELERQMESLGPIAPDFGKRFAGRTSFTFAWRFETDRLNGLCDVVSTTGVLDITVTLPSWAGAGTAPEGLANGWVLYLARLRSHEDGHRNIDVRGAADVLRAIRAVAPQASCPGLEHAANAAGQDALAKVRADNVAYDSATDHGRAD